MNLGTIVHQQEIYNLDYMTSQEIKELLSKIERSKSKGLTKMKNQSKLSREGIRI